MSFSRTPSRSRSSLGNYSGSASNSSTSLNTPKGQLTTPRVSLTDFRRPPSARSTRPSSPRLSVSGGPPPSFNNRSRPSSSVGMRSRPTTPSFIKQDPYTGSISVSIRPNPYSVDPNNGSQWFIEEESGTIINNEDSTEFNFDNVFLPDPNISNRHVYQKSCAPLVHRFLNDGYNSTVFAYGMTGSGKTFSMRGTDEDPGFVKLAVDEIFDKIENDVSKQYTVSITYLEIYNERIIDLLNSGPPISSDLKIRDDPIYGNKIIGITNPLIKSREQVIQYINRGDNNRKTSETDFNARSSRSHAILQIKLHTRNHQSGIETNATLSLCDLAGSEKATSSVERRKEGSFINKSLLALSTVINKLSYSSKTGSLNEHIPYRDSKLTRLLQPALSGASLVLVLCTIHMGASGMNNRFADNQFVSETYNTLRFAARAKDIVINVQKAKSTLSGDSDSARIINELRKTIEQQKAEIIELKAGNMNMNTNNNMLIDEPLNPLLIQLESENRMLTERIEHLNRLNDLQKTETVILKNDALNDLLGSNLDHSYSQVMIANLEEFYKRVNHEMEEYRSYIIKLETQIKSFTQESGHKHTSKLVQGLNERQVDALIKEQEEEIIQLKEAIKDKDHFIKSLTKTSKLRRLVDSDFINTESPLSDKSDKENNQIREYNIGKKNGESMHFVI